MFVRSQMLGGLWGRATMSPVDDAGAAAALAEAAAPAPADAQAGADHEAGDAADAAAATREADDADARGEPTPEPEKPRRQPWQDKRINKLTADAKAAQEARDEALARAAASDARAASYEALYGRPDGSPAPAAAAAPSDPAARTYTQAELQTEAARIASVNRLNERIEGVFDAGQKSKGAEWNNRVNQAAAAFGPDLQQRPDLFEAITGLPNGDEVYFALAGDLDHFAEVLTMPPVQMGMELARLSQKAGARGPGPNVSRVPAPITPLDAPAPEEVSMEKMDMNDFAKLREVQVAARAAERR